MKTIQKFIGNEMFGQELRPLFFETNIRGGENEEDDSQEENNTQEKNNAKEENNPSNNDSNSKQFTFPNEQDSVEMKQSEEANRLALYADGIEDPELKDQITGIVSSMRNKIDDTLYDSRVREAEKKKEVMKSKEKRSKHYKSRMEHFTAGENIRRNNEVSVAEHKIKMNTFNEQTNNEIEDRGRHWWTLGAKKKTARNAVKSTATGTYGWFGRRLLNLSSGVGSLSRGIGNLGLAPINAGLGTLKIAGTIIDGAWNGLMDPKPENKSKIGEIKLLKWFKKGGSKKEATA